MKNTGHRIWKTYDGRYVLEGHEDAAFLAYTEHDEVPQEVLDSLSEDSEDEDVPETHEEDSKPAEGRTEPQERKPRRAKETK